MNYTVSATRMEKSTDGIRIPDHKHQIGTSGQYKHRSGWPYVVSTLKAASGVEDILLDDYVERTFKSKYCGSTVRATARAMTRDLVERIYPVAATSTRWKEPWVGIFHHPPNIPEWLAPAAHPREILAGWRFRMSCPHLRGAISLSEYLAEWLRKELTVPVMAIKHPTEFPASKFTWKAFEENREKKLVQVGWYLRNYRAIYQVQVPEEFQKVHLSQKGSAIAEAKQRTDRYSPYRSRLEVGHVQVASWLADADYDRLLTENVVFMELLDASANNAVIEAIVRETPLIVNRHPAIVEYLGERYPLLYDDLSEIPILLNMSRIKEAHEYLRAMDKSELRIEHFIREVQNFLREVI